jgi:hypothetical protein
LINLIPKEEKKEMIVDFYFRLALLFFVVISFCILIFFGSLLPSYLLSSAKVSIVANALEMQKKEPIPLLDQESLFIIKDLNNKLDVVEKSEKNKFLPSMQVINSILLKKRPDIKITQILYENDAIKGRKISINGTAPSREVLLLFRLALEDGATFKSVDLPISNFVKGSNIQFYLSLVPSI